MRNCAMPIPVHGVQRLLLLQALVLSRYLWSAGFLAMLAAADAASLSQENRALKAQLERMVVERDTLRGKVGLGSGVCCVVTACLPSSQPGSPPARQ
jgi:hypothetical protein